PGVLRSAAVGIAGGRVVAVGAADELRRRWPDVRRESWRGCVLVPGFVDSHTHAVFGRWRVDEFEARARGRGYMEIHASGGGIGASVRDLRAQDEATLLERARPRLRRMLEHGTTTVEIKSGYGLRLEDEVKMLRVIRTLGAEGPWEVVPTFLGTHALPPEFAARRDAYVEHVTREMIPRVAAEGLAEFCDAFVEPGVFTAEDGERILSAAREHGLGVKVHADEFEWSGGAELAVRLGAVSADHLGAVSEEGIRALAGSGTVATLLPGTALFLGHTRYAPARRLIDAGAAVALATDFNPGTSPSTHLPLMMSLAVTQMRMTPAEALAATSVNGAAALGRGDGLGTLEVGAPADLAAFRVGEYREIAYRYGENHCVAVWKRGLRVV
ncbi:MAG: imidazolonepropionase, partial [Gemmatimonadota bacterium]